MSNNGSGDDLQSRYEFNSTWAERIAFLIIVGLTVEIASVFILEKPLLWEGMLTIVANVLIVAGVWGELRFSSRAKAASDRIVAAAHSRAAEAQEELTRFRTQRSDLMTNDVLASITEKLKPFAGTEFDVGHERVDREQWDFMWRLEPAIRAADWEQLNWIGGYVFKKQNWPGDHVYGEMGVINVVLELHKEGEHLRPAAEALAAALRDTGVTTIIASAPNNSSLNFHALHLLVGMKQ